MLARHPFLSGTGPILFAHRGGGLEAPENTRAAFAHAVEVGCSHIETDIQVSRDGVAVLFHDDTLDRTTDAQGPVSDFTWNQLRSVGTPAGVGQLLRLDEALEEFPDRFFNLDLKVEESVEPALDVIDSLRAHHRVMLGSFSDSRLARARRRGGPQLATSAGPREVVAAVASARGLPFPRPSLTPLALQVPVSQGPVRILTPRFLDQAHERGQQVHVWTINDEPEMRRLLDMGVDGIVTDRPTLLRQVLQDRGEWGSDEN